jgi:transmembrane sensor
MNEKEVKDLLDRYRSGTASEADRALLESWYPGYREEGTEELGMEERILAVDMVWKNLNRDEQKIRKIWSWPRVAAAALVLMSFSVGTYIYLTREKTIDTAHLANTRFDIAPGSNKAVLTLANGKMIKLSDAKKGVVVNAAEVNYNDGSRIDTSSADNKIQKTKENLAMLSTPIGGTYQLILPDGTKVWLNAGSSIKFPVSFAGLKERKVALTGEAYFEVFKNKALPFRVVSTGQVVEVLGTHFDINTYTDEPTVKTTLLEGSVKINTVTLKPGEQARRIAGSIQVAAVNTDEVVGWKNDYIVFEDEKIESVMRKIARWYKVEVVYEGEKPTDDFGGRVKRSAYVSQVLTKLELTNKVHFSVKGRRIIVKN